MELLKQPRINNRQTMPISSLSLDKDDLKKLCNILQERANSAAEIEVNLYNKGEQSDDQYEEHVKTLRESFKLKITISGKSGEELWGTIDEVFNSVNFPEEVESFYVSSDTTLKAVHNYYPHNSFIIFLDFNKSKIFDFSLMPSDNTPNRSNIEVGGYDATWVNGVFNELKTFIASRSSKLSVVHNHSIYDIFLWVLGYPISFWVCSKLSTQIESTFDSGSVFIVSALYVYTFVATLVVFRFLFHYLRWVCPLVEYRGKTDNILAHRAVLTALVLGWFGTFIYDVVRALWN